MARTRWAPGTRLRPPRSAPRPQSTPRCRATRTTSCPSRSASGSPRWAIRGPLQPLRLDRHGRLRPPAYGRAGWYAGGPEPGEPRAAVIAGHLDSASGPDVFATLAQARPGDRVLVDLVDGTVVDFRIVEVGQFPQRQFPTRRVYADTPRPVLRLITCGGAYDDAAGRYLDNVVAFARRA